MKKTIKKIGKFFINLAQEREVFVGGSILIVDNGYALFEQINCAVKQIKETFPMSRVSVLALDNREGLKDNFSDIEIIQAGKCIIKRYSIARHMISLRKNRYDHVILLSLDITPIIVSILFMNTNVFLYNKWHQWWSLKPRPVTSYWVAIPQFIFNCIIFAYLLVSVWWIFLRRSFNVFRNRPLGRMRFSVSKIALVFLVILGLASAVLAANGFIEKEKECMKRILVEDSLQVMLKDKRRLEKDLNLSKKNNEKTKVKIKQMELRLDKLLLQIKEEKDRAKSLALDLAAKKKEIMGLMERLKRNKREKAGILNKLEELQFDYEKTKRDSSRLKNKEGLSWDLM